MHTPILCTLYTVIVMIIVSLSLTYNITYKFFGDFVDKTTQESYGTGMDFKQPGFLIHIIVFAILIFIPSYIYRKK